MNRITSTYLPRARTLLAAFRQQGAPGAGAKRLSNQAEAARQRSPGGWPVSREQLASELQQRLDGVTLPHQRGTSYCGCAAFLYCLLEDRPDWYVAYATALWRGEPFTFASARERLPISVNPVTLQSLTVIQQDQTAAPSISNLDWMTMASLSGATRRRRGAPATATRPTDEARSITWPWMVRRWFDAVGAPAAIDSVGLGAFAASMEDLLALLSRWGSHWLVMQIDSSLLNGGSTSITQRHWVVVDPDTRPLIQPPGQRGGLSPSDFVTFRQRQLATHTNAYSAVAHVEGLGAAQTNLRVVSWANEHTRISGSTIGNVADRFYGGYAFPRFGR